MAVLKIENLSKTYKSRRVVQDVSLEVESGEIIGLLGPNGAGKTTTVRRALSFCFCTIPTEEAAVQINMLNGIYAPTSGDAQVYGRSVSTQMANIRGMIGNCFQHDVLYLELTVKQHVAMYAVA